MVLVMSLGCGLMTGMSNGFLSLKETLDFYIKEAQYPDVVITTKVTTKDVVDKLKAIDGVEEVNARITGNLALINKEGRFISVQAMTYDEDEFQEFYFWEKAEEKGEYPILLEHGLSEKFDYHVGDEVEVRVEEEVRTGTVYGIVSRPEMLAPPSFSGISMVSGDIGYLYVPTIVLADEENTDHTKAVEEWEEYNEEYEKAKADAESEHNKALAEISDAEKELGEKKTELDRGIKEAEEKKKELAGDAATIDDKLKELDNLEKELKEKKTSLDEGYAGLEAGKQSLENSKAQLAKKRAELNAKKKELEDQKADLLAKLEEVNNGLAELKDKRQSLENWKALVEALKENRELIERLEKEFIDLDDVYSWGKFAVMIMDIMLPQAEEIAEKLEEAHDKVVYYDIIITQLENAGLDATEYIESRQEILDILALIGITPEELESFKEGYKEFIEEMQDERRMLILMLDVLSEPENIQILRDKLVQTCNDFLDKYILNHTITEYALDAVDKYIADKEAKLNEAEATLLDYKKQIEDGLKQIEDGLAQIEDGFKELAGYDAKIREGEDTIRRTSEELDGYKKQIEDGNKQISDGRAQAKEYKNRIDSGIRQIDGEVTKGKNEYADGERKLAEAKTELDDRWADAEDELKSAKEELTKTKEELDSWEGYDEYCNQFLFKVAEGSKPVEVLNAATKVLDDKEILDSYTFEHSDVNHRIHANLDPLEIMALYVPIIFFVVALIVVFLFMSLLIRQCRREIGILRALGYSRNTIVLAFCAVSAFASLCAVGLGTLIGFGVTRFIGTFFKGFFDLYFFNYSFHYKRFIISTALTFAVGEMATVFGTGFVSRISPSEAMSRPAPPENVHAGSFMKNVNPFFKYSVLTILRSKARFAVSVLCLSSSVMLIFISVSFYLSTDKILNDYFKKRVNYDCEIYTKGDPSEEFIRHIEEKGYAHDPEVVRYYNRSILANGEMVSVCIKAIPVGSDKINIFDSKEKKVALPLDGLVLEKHSADLLHVDIGDEVLIDGIYYPVNALSDQSEARFQYISDESAKTLGKPDFYSVIVNIDEKDEIAFLEDMSLEDEYAYASFTQRTYKAWAKDFGAFTAASVLTIVFAVVIGFVVVSNTLRTNLQQQKRELCVVRTLGFLRSELSAKMFSQAGLYYLFAGVIGLPLGVVITKRVLLHLEIDSRSYPFVNTPVIYLLTMGIVLAYVLIGHLMSMNIMKKWDIVESVKDKE